jgi:hypothetical protein
MRNLCDSLLVFIVLCAAGGVWAKESPDLVMLWPNQSNPTLKLTFAKFQQLSEAYEGKKSYAADVTIQNLTDKHIDRASFTVYFFDKQKVRIGDTSLQVHDLGPKQQVKDSLQFFSIGWPATLELKARNDAAGIPRKTDTVPLKIITVPAGANLKVDGHDAGVSPKTVNLSVGNHILDFTKEGYAPGSTPVEITGDEAPGGSITIELGGLSHDTLELRDGSVLLGDFVSASMTEVVFSTNGEARKIDRNRVKKILLVEREIVPQEPVSTVK